MEGHYYYIGCFVSREELFHCVKGISTGHLDRLIEAPHITFEYKPDEVDESLFGERIRVVAVGYGNDGQNEGLKVKVYADNKKITGMAEEIEVPHITLSVGMEGRAYDTRHLEFYAIKPFELEGVFGGYRQDGTINTMHSLD